MGFSDWFRRSYKVIRLLRGARGKYRWTARINGDLMAVSPVRGYRSEEEAREKALQVLGSGWDITPCYPQDAAGRAEGVKRSKHGILEEIRKSRARNR